MKRKTKPSITADYTFDSLTDISVEFVRYTGAKLIALDLDNTCVRYGSLRLEPGTREWVERMKSSGIDVMILSNTIFSRAFILSKMLGGLPFIAPAIKPQKIGISLAARRFGVSFSEILVIGDKWKSDIAVANRVGAFSARVTPLSEKRSPLTVGGMQTVTNMGAAE